MCFDPLDVCFLLVEWKTALSDLNCKNTSASSAVSVRAENVQDITERSLVCFHKNQSNRVLVVFFLRQS